MGRKKKIVAVKSKKDKSQQQVYLNNHAIIKELLNKTK